MAEYSSLIVAPRLVASRIKASHFRFGTWIRDGMLVNGCGNPWRTRLVHTATQSAFDGRSAAPDSCSACSGCLAPDEPERSTERQVVTTWARFVSRDLIDQVRPPTNHAIK